MTYEKGKNGVFQKIEKCINSFNLAVKVFQNFLGDKSLSDPMTYYEARKYFEEGKNFYHEALSEISKLIGSLPMDTSPGFKKWRESFIKGIGITSESKEFEALKLELQNDEFLVRFLTSEEIDALLMKHFESQQAGKRKLSNIKARIILDEIINLMTEAETLYIKSKEKLYQLR
jgi:hypothetical protein